MQVVGDGDVDGPIRGRRLLQLLDVESQPVKPLRKDLDQSLQLPVAPLKICESLLERAKVHREIKEAPNIRLGPAVDS